MTAIKQLDPPMPFVTKGGEQVLALMVIDYGPEWDAIFLCGYRKSRELWWLPNSELRMADNVTFGRTRQDASMPEESDAEAEE